MVAEGTQDDHDGLTGSHWCHYWRESGGVPAPLRSMPSSEIHSCHAQQTLGGLREVGWGEPLGGNQSPALSWTFWFNIQSYISIGNLNTILSVQ